MCSVVSLFVETVHTGDKGGDQTNTVEKRERKCDVLVDQRRHLLLTSVWKSLMSLSLNP